ncbi:MAG: SDR family NAD(P)-dependent oxidoreductase [Betaproteobacteria bacterium]|nr:SDR family NAD(P)-dependent oxidoreductase [Betaproteobacteria bacterium]
MNPQVVLISGCSSGFGLLIAVVAARQGHRVFATLRDAATNGALQAAADAAQVKVELLTLDVDDQASIDRCVAEVLAVAGRIDCLINNAGFAMGGSVFDLSMAELRAQMETNFFGAVALTKAVLPGMIARRSGLIIQMSSIAALNSNPGLGAYCASKRALEGITEALRYEVADFGIRVASILPGMYRTDVWRKRKLAAQFGAAQSPFGKRSSEGLQLIDKLVESHARDPQEVADLVLRLMAHPNPPLQTLSGLDAKIQTLLRSLLPARWWELIVRKAAGLP